MATNTALKRFTELHFVFASVFLISLPFAVYSFWRNETYWSQLKRVPATLVSQKMEYFWSELSDCHVVEYSYVVDGKPYTAVSHIRQKKKGRVKSWETGLDFECYYLPSNPQCVELDDNYAFMWGVVSVMLFSMPLCLWSSRRRREELGKKVSPVNDEWDVELKDPQ